MRGIFFNFLDKTNMMRICIQSLNFESTLLFLNFLSARQLFLEEIEIASAARNNRICVWGRGRGRRHCLVAN